MSKHPPALPRDQRPWPERNWKWLLPVALTALAGIVFAFIAGVVSVMKSSEPYQLAIARARSSPAVVAALGEPITEGFLMLGNIHVSGTAGQAQFEIPLRAPREAGTLYAVANRAAGVWKFETLMVVGQSSHTRINLLPPDAGNPLK
ncbi:MAG: Fungal protein of unknown function [Verrucomicrobia bacterium]|nr:Fungal protein of unknown function [Verrucomicrobiota bacterium]